MIAQMFLVNGDALVPLEPSTTFRTNHFDTIPIAAAYVYPQMVNLPLPPGCTVIFRFRVWEGTKGTTYEEAEANGGYFGESEITLTVGGCASSARRTKCIVRVYGPEEQPLTR